MREVRKRPRCEVDEDQNEIDVRDQVIGEVEQERRRENQEGIFIVLGDENGANVLDESENYHQHQYHQHHQYHNHCDHHHCYQQRTQHNNVMKRMKVVESLESTDRLKIFYKVFDTVNRITQRSESLGQLFDYNSVNSMDEMSDDIQSNPSSPFSTTACRSALSSSEADLQQNFELSKKREIVSALLQKFSSIYA